MTELVRGLHNLRAHHRPCAATIGSFDGVHRGHQAVISSLQVAAAQRSLPAILVTFEPQPREYFNPASSPPRLTRLREKLQALSRYGVERVLCLRFNAQLASLTADEFMRQILVDGLGVRYLMVGDDFRFGKDRTGNFTLLQQAGGQYGFEVSAIDTFDIGDGRVSSTRVRDSLAAGDLEWTAELLGRPFTLCGRVAHGDKRGRTIGFPTANIRLHRHRSPLSGVFAVHMSWPGARPHAGVANIGKRPTVDGTWLQLEVHLFDFDRDIYGQHVEVEFLHKLRDEQRFDSFDALREQIQRDAIQARKVFTDSRG
ncbi:MAG: bifunctional riboflavin kinase/FAD synthetase [Halobacteria archaeon]|nr:bifunctional riboflavin kinase/FAD synthetase [Halobacteria archaeon]